MLRQVEQQLDEDLAQAILRDEVSDEALEAAAFVAGLPTLIHGSYCFTCLVDKPSALENNGLGFKLTVKVGR